MGTLITGIIVLTAVCLAVRQIRREKKSGAACSCNCAGCSKCPTDEKQPDATK